MTRLLFISGVLSLFLGCARTLERTGPDGGMPLGTRFSSPEEAVSALKRAVSERNETAVLALFGPQGEALVNSGDPVADSERMSKFAQLLTEREAIEAQPDGDVLLLVGNENWPFPIPLTKVGRREWAFDTLRGKEEILNRRIGENELKTVRVAQAYVDAQREYYKKDWDRDGVKEYAQRLASTPGSRDGLFWKSTDPKDQSPFGPFAAEAAAEGYRLAKDEPVPYHGYFFKILTEQGPDASEGERKYLTAKEQMTRGFGLVAYPARWGSSGIMSFIVNDEGVVYEKDLGVQTLTLASGMKAFNPDPSWKPVDEEAVALAVE